MAYETWLLYQCVAVALVHYNSRPLQDDFISNDICM